MKIAQLGLLLAIVFGFISRTNAGVLIEPLVGYNFSTKAEIATSTTNEKYSGGSGGAYGGRLGYQNFGFQLGLDYLNSNIDMNNKDFDSNVKTSEWAGFVGFKFPILLRVYGGYIFSANGTTKYDDPNNGLGIQKVTLQGGSGFKYGLSFTGLPFVAINFEFRSGKFDQNKLDNVAWKSDFKYQSYLVSLSLPLEF